MSFEDSLLRCFVSGPSVKWDDHQITKDAAPERGQIFTEYIWGTDGISSTLKTLNHSDYGKDLVLILFQFYVDPLQEELAHLKEIENYRKKERSIGVPIIVNEDNFFSRTDAERRLFLKHSILAKLRLLEEVVAKKTLDTNVRKLKKDLEKILSYESAGEPVGSSEEETIPGNEEHYF